MAGGTWPFGAHMDSMNQVFTQVGVVGTLGTADVGGTARVLPAAIDPTTGAQYVNNIGAPSGNPTAGTLNTLGTLGVLQSGTLNSATVVLNSGTINVGTVVNNGGTLGVLQAGTINAATVVLNSGTINVGTVVSNGGTIGVLQAGTINSATVVLNSGTINVATAVMPSGTLNVGTINTGTFAMTSGTLNVGTVVNNGGTIGVLQAGTINAATVVLNSGTINVATAVMPSGTLNIGTINTGTINLGTFQLNPIPTIGQSTYGTLGTTGVSLVGTLAGGTSTGAGTEIFLTSVSLTIPSTAGSQDVSIGWGTAAGTFHSGTASIVRGNFPAGGGIQKTFTPPINSGTNAQLAYFQAGAGTVNINVTYFITPSTL